MNHPTDPDDTQDARLGTQVGAYRLLRRLGVGGMGTVYLGERETGGFAQHVAIKIVHARSELDSVRERFEAEREILAGLRHPNIATLLGGGTTGDGLPYYVMEWIDGSVLTEHCERARLDTQARVRVLLAIAQALAHAHRHLVVHRDIKPSNILVAQDGTPKLLDFGIAKRLDDPGLTRAEAGPMTLEFAAPEQFRGERVTVATDVYQWGVLAFLLLTGRLPYDADPGNGYAWSRAVSENEPLSLARACAREERAAAVGDTGPVARSQRQLRGDLDAIVRRALEKSPARRFGSMDALAADLRAWLERRPVSAQRATAWYLTRRFLARHALAAALSAAALGTVVSGGAVAWHQADVAQTQAGARRRSRPLRRCAGAPRGRGFRISRRHVRGAGPGRRPRRSPVGQ